MGYSSRLTGMGRQRGPFYFAKVDVKACFDNIPADKALEMTKALLSHSEYNLYRHARVGKPVVTERPNQPPVIKSRIKFVTDGTAGPPTVVQPGRPDQVYVGPISQRHQKSREGTLSLLEQHLLGNIVKIGRKFYRQKLGIPQGSVVSTMLCTLFYNQLEKAELAFVDRPDTLLLRLIDDFMVITTDRPTANRFLKVMHGGIPAFGISVNPSKSMANFDIQVNGTPVHRCPSTTFAYCGVAIDIHNLSVSKDKDRLDPSGRLPHAMASLTR
jgi:telomerase reverse transcriptase